MSKHTPGPWESHQTRGNNNFDYTLSKMVGVFPGEMATIEFGSSERAEANAKLIAAAPDLLAACKAIWGLEDELIDELLEGDLGAVKSGSLSLALCKIEAAIKKATE